MHSFVKHQGDYILSVNGQYPPQTSHHSISTADIDEQGPPTPRDIRTPDPKLSFHKHTKLPILALLPTFYFHIFAVFFSICRYDINNWEIRCQWVQDDYISRL